MTSVFLHFHPPRGREGAFVYLSNSPLREMSHMDVRALRPIKSGELVYMDRDISDRSFPDIDQMLLDCAQPIR